MSELPKFVLQRLAASAVPAEHPGADLLAAFAEHSLSGAEREKLLVHLATCHQCREVVWLALPEMEAEQPVVNAARPRWVPAWRWVGVAAAVVVVATVALVYRGGPGPAAERAAAMLPARVAVQRQETAVPEVKQPASAPTAESRLQARNTPARVMGGARFNKQAAAQPQAGLMAKNEAAKELPASAEAAQNQIGGVDALDKSSDEVALKDEARASAAPSRAPAANALSAAKTAPASTSAAGVVIASNVNASDMGKKKLAPPTRWMLSPNGALLRSTDAGQNWQTVPFAGSAVFHAVAVVGPNVWVGGRGGALYFSADDGNQWTRLSPAAAGVPPNEDISKLAFHDGQHGSLTTAGGQVWITSDGGRSWQKQ